jgi:hypothetical protein
MSGAFPQLHGAWIVGALVGALVAAIGPTCLYLYVEPRGRKHWARAGDSSATRRASLLVRVTAWLGFFLGQMALVWVVVPAACVALFYVQTKVGAGRPVGLTVTIACGIVAAAQAALAIGFVPLGVRLLVRDARLTASRAARRSAIGSAFVLAACALMSWSLKGIPGLVHPWLAAALGWAAIRPTMAYAVACLLHAGLLERCALVVADARRPPA